MHRKHFWHVGRQAIVKNVIRARGISNLNLSIDVGCGPGYQLENWKEISSTVIGLDQHAGEIDAQMFPPGISLTKGDIEALPFENKSVDLFIGLDVIEHVDDNKALREALRVLKPGGYCLLSVPAHQALWSIRDVEAGHKRRYSKKQLMGTVKDAGLEILSVRYFQFCLLPLVFITRFAGRSNAKLRDHEDFPPTILNGIFKWINVFEARLDALGLRLPTGSSLILLARKPW